MSKVEAYKNMLDCVPCGICRVALDENLTVLYANPPYYRIYGYTPQEAEEKGFTNARFILPKEDYQSIRMAIDDSIARGDREFQLEYRGVHSSGKLMWLLVHCAYDPKEPDSMICALVDIARRKQMEEELRISIEESKTAYRLTDKIMYTYDVAERRLHQPVAIADEFGLPPVVEDAPYSIVRSGAIDPESEGDYLAFYEAIIRGEPGGHAVVKKRRQDGTFGWYEAKYASIYDDEGHARRAIISCEDVTRQREKELTYQKWSQFFKAQEGKTIGVYEYNLTRDTFDEDAGDIPPEYLQPLKKYTDTVQYVAENFVYEEDKARFYGFFNRDSQLIRYYDGQQQGELEYLRKRHDGSLYWARAITLLLADPYSDDVRLFMMTQDIDKEKRADLKLRSQTELDGMTGLFNRETFIGKVSAVLAGEGAARHHALIMLDIDQFKMHNDVHGHPFGDQVIRETAWIIRDFLRKSDICGRMGGDEFMVFLNDIETEEGIMPRIAMLCQLLHRIYTGKGEISCSMGVAFYPQDGRDFQVLYQHADEALYEAKHAGRGTYRIYREPDLS